MRPINVYSLDGTFEGKDLLGGCDFSASRPHSQAVFDAILVEHHNSRQGTHGVKTKAEVSGTGKKPYRQKHTGRARQGSRRNPQFRGGGVAFGPRPNRNYSIRVNRKVNALALESTWGNIFRLGNLGLLDSTFTRGPIKTREFHAFLNRIGALGKRVLVLLTGAEDGIFLSARNIGGVRIRSVDTCSVRDLWNQSHLLISEGAFGIILQRLSR